MILENTDILKSVGKVRFVFEDADSYENFENITQSYGLCFNEQGEIIIVNFSAFGSGWILPGGTIEEGETPEDTLHREVMEEADITIENITLLGGQRCYLLDKPEEKTNSQLRFVCLIKKILSQTPDPDNGMMIERKFVKPEKLNNYLKWGLIGDYLAKRAKEWFEKLKK